MHMAAVGYIGAVVVAHMAHSGRSRTDAVICNFSPIVFGGKYGLLFVVAAHLLLLESMLVYVRQSDADTRKFRC